jgi:parallel beta-helix repeat protein
VTGTQASWATDDSAAIQTAISHLTSGGQITFSRLCGVGHAGWQGLSISTPNVTLSGRGKGTGLMIFYTPTLVTAPKVEPYSALKSMNASGLSIRKLEIDGNGIVSTLLGLFYISNSTFAENYFHNTGKALGNCIFSLWGKGNAYTSNTASHCGHGLWLGNPNTTEQAETNATITHNVVTDNLGSGLGGTIRNSLIDSNTILRNGGSCIPLGSTPTGVFEQVTISHNTCEYNAWNGVQSDTAPGSSGIPTSDPVRLMTGAPHNITIIDNVIDHNGIAGITATYAVSWVIENNRIYDNGYWDAVPEQQRDLPFFSAASSGLNPGSSGIVIGFAADVKVINNQIYDDQNPPTQVIGIAIGAGAPGTIKGIILDGNTIRNHRTEGVHVAANGAGTGDSVTITHNTVQNNGGYGIAINKGYTNLKVLNNVATANAKADYRGDVVVQGDKNTFSKTEGQRTRP